MKILIKVISPPEKSKSLIREFTIEENKSELSFTNLLSTLNKQAPDLYSDITEDKKLSSQYMCIVNNELVFHNRLQTEDGLILHDGDKMSISFVIGGG